MSIKNPSVQQLAFEKKRTALKGYCLGRDYVDVLRAITFAEGYHTGFRKDGVTPEFQHQIEIALHATTLKGLSNADESILLQMIMLHDVVEDYNVPLSVIELHFGAVVAKGVEALSKIVNGVKKPMVQYMQDLALNPLAALAKGCDRVHNVQSMRGVFNYEKKRITPKKSVNTFSPCCVAYAIWHPNTAKQSTTLKICWKRKCNGSSTFTKALMLRCKQSTMAWHLQWQRLQAQRRSQETLRACNKASI